MKFLNECLLPNMFAMSDGILFLLIFLGRYYSAGTNSLFGRYSYTYYEGNDKLSITGIVNDLKHIYTS